MGEADRRADHDPPTAARSKSLRGHDVEMFALLSPDHADDRPQSPYETFMVEQYIDDEPEPYMRQGAMHNNPFEEYDDDEMKSPNFPETQDFLGLHHDDNNYQEVSKAL